MRKIGIFLFIFISLCLYFNFLLSGYDPNLIHLDSIYQSPSKEYIFGTDSLGRDLFIRLLFALKTSFLIGIFASFFTICFACFYVFLMRLVFYSFFIRLLNIFLSLPILLLLMFFQSFLQGGFWSMIFIIALAHFPFIAKVLEDELKHLEKLEFYECALVLGCSKIRAFFKELLPPCFSLLMVLFVLNVIHAINTESTLSFFGLGLAFEIPSLGNILNDASKAIFLGAWWMIVFPLLFILGLILPLLLLARFWQNIFGIRL